MSDYPYGSSDNGSQRSSRDQVPPSPFGAGSGSGGDSGAGSGWDSDTDPTTSATYGPAYGPVDDASTTQAQAQPQAAPEESNVPAPPNHEGPKKPRRGLRMAIAGFVGGVLGAAVLTGALYAGGYLGSSTTSSSSSSSQAIVIDPDDEDVTTATAVAAKVLSSVCTVYCTYEDGTGLGSGVIYDTDGNIITNNHVIEDAESITVTIDGTSYDATLVGTDASSDIAVIKADLGDDTVTPIEVGDSDELQVGDWVMTVGSPFGLENSVSQDIVSALSRSTVLEDSSSSTTTLYTNLIQTDATINPGNSGGALVNSEGQLVGICTLFSSDTESFAGIGYAIPGNYAVEIADKLIAGETVTHAYIGITMQTVSSSNAFRYGLSVEEGAYVVEVTEGGPADEAGIEAGDVITQIGDDTISSADEALLAIRSHSVGETVTVTVMRGDEELSFDVTLGSDEALQEAEEEDDETVTIDGEEISINDLIDLYQQYQQEQQMSPNGGF